MEPAFKRRQAVQAGWHAAASSPLLPARPPLQHPPRRRFTNPKGLVLGATSGGGQAPRGGYTMGTWVQALHAGSCLAALLRRTGSTGLAGAAGRGPRLQRCLLPPS